MLREVEDLTAQQLMTTRSAFQLAATREPAPSGDPFDASAHPVEPQELRTWRRPSRETKARLTQPGP